MSSAPDHYETLQVHPAAEPEVIQAAYRRLSLKYHPDVYRGADAHQRMALLNAAYAVLGDAAKRRSYDRERQQRPPAPATEPARPQLLVLPNRVDLGRAPIGGGRTLSVRVINAGRGRLAGTVTVRVPWITVTPMEFSGNEAVLTIRFQPAVSGPLASDQAIEVRSNGGIAVIQVHGVGLERGREAQATPTTDPSAGGPTKEGIARRPAMAVSHRHRGSSPVPTWAWMTVGAALTTYIWFLIHPAVALIPLGLAGWLAYERFARRASATEGPAPAAANAGNRPDGRCRWCGDPLRQGAAGRCRECGGAICRACGVCPCGANSRPAAGRRS